MLLVAHNGKVGYFKAIGFQDREKQITMKPDSIFWVASLTKPIATVAAMMLVEQGKIQIDDPVARYLPELSSMQGRCREDRSLFENLVYQAVDK